MLFTLEIYYFMLERIEIKKLVKQAVSRDPPLNMNVDQYLKVFIITNY
nr:MAG: hypothetical protein [Bacteriophage sp.]